jgi:hypothetical protein
MPLEITFLQTIHVVIFTVVSLQSTSKQSHENESTSWQSHENDLTQEHYFHSLGDGDGHSRDGKFFKYYSTLIIFIISEI